jgi:arylsulfatase A
MNMPKKPFATLITALLLAPTATLQAGDAAVRKPNIVIMLVDDMGYGDPACYNPQSKIPTPNIDRLAREGMRFTDAHARAALPSIALRADDRKISVPHRHHPLAEGTAH